RRCVVCGVKEFQKKMHLFTRVPDRRVKWVDSVCQTPEQKNELYRKLDATVTPYICSSHFSPSDYNKPHPNTFVLRNTAVPCFVRSTVILPIVIPPHSPIPSSSSYRPPPLLSRLPPPCCTCCCRPEQWAADPNLEEELSSDEEDEDDAIKPPPLNPLQSLEANVDAEYPAL
ncbi:hypothetical protein PENTCL1PPCAC_30146, partial [Pristionchus entomophagus]